MLVVVTYTWRHEAMLPALRYAIELLLRLLRYFFFDAMASAKDVFTRMLYHCLSPPAFADTPPPSRFHSLLRHAPPRCRARDSAAPPLRHFAAAAAAW